MSKNLTAIRICMRTLLSSVTDFSIPGDLPTIGTNWHTMPYPTFAKMLLAVSVYIQWQDMLIELDSTCAVQWSFAFDESDTLSDNGLGPLGAPQFYDSVFYSNLYCHDAIAGSISLNSNLWIINIEIIFDSYSLQLYQARVINYLLYDLDVLSLPFIG